MIKLIAGGKGSGKTKKLVDLVVEAVNIANGDVVVIEKEQKLTFDIPYSARLVNASDYPVGSYEFIKGFICGLHSGNYDITHILIDNFLKMVDEKSPEALAEFVGWLEGFSNRENIEFVLSLSLTPEELPEQLTQFLCN